MEESHPQDIDEILQELETSATFQPGELAVNLSGNELTISCGTQERRIDLSNYVKVVAVSDPDSNYSWGLTYNLLALFLELVLWLEHQEKVTYTLFGIERSGHRDELVTGLKKRQAQHLERQLQGLLRTGALTVEEATVAAQDTVEQPGSAEHDLDSLTEAPRDMAAVDGGGTEAERQLLSCPSCGVRNPANSDFCAECGSAVMEPELTDAAEVLRLQLQPATHGPRDGRIAPGASDNAQRTSLNRIWPGVVVGAATAALPGILLLLTAVYSDMTTTAQGSRTGIGLLGLCGFAQVTVGAAGGAFVGGMLGALGKSIGRKIASERGETAGLAVGGFLGGAMVAAAMIALFAVPGSQPDEERRSQLNAEELLLEYEAGELRFDRVALPETDLAEADFEFIRLRDADLRGADLHGANLSGALLNRANLSYANLSYANLSYADLSGANLSYANLEGAQVTREQLQQAASLQGATLPDGTVHE